MNKKNHGQYMTPDGIVNMILDNIGYTEEHTINKTICEPSFGDGAFLINIIQRIIDESERCGFSSDEIKKILLENVYGIEIDKCLYSKALARISNLLKVYNISISEKEWKNNLICGDSLLIYSKWIGKFDYVVGNPPYVRVHNMDENVRRIVRSFPHSKEGMTDLYIVFYEIGIEMLNQYGKLGYISPNSFMKNTSEKEFRNFLIKKEYIAAIFDFKTSKLFKGVDTYDCICILDKNSERAEKTVDYREYKMYEQIASNMFTYKWFKNVLTDKTWNLSSQDDIDFLEDNQSRPIKINNIAIVQNGIATNKDSLYVVKVYIDEKLQTPYMEKSKNIVYFKDENGEIRKIESGILRRCIKASRFDGNITNTYIIFPYKPNTNKELFSAQNGKKIDNGYIPYSESELEKKFPCAYNYFLSYWEELTSRDMDKNTPWFAFGRSQGLANSGFKKVVFKHVISKEKPIIKPYIVDKDVIVYSGMYTTIDISNCVSSSKNKLKFEFNEKLYDAELTEIKDVFASGEFAKYCSIVGKDMSGGYVGISTKNVKAFGTNMTKFPNLPVEIPADKIKCADRHYMNDLFQQSFLDCIKKSYEKMGEFNKTSTERIKPFHGFLAKVLQYKLGTEYQIYADGYSYGKEISLGGNFDNKNVDICVMKNEKPIGAIAFKLLSNNFKQNNKNFVEGMLGEVVQMRESEIPYAFCYLIPEKALYLSGKASVTNDMTQKFDHLDILTQNDMLVYYKIMNDEAYKGRKPDAMFIGVHKLFDDTYINSLKKRDSVCISSDKYLSHIIPAWSDYSFIKDEKIREYFQKHCNIGNFIDEFIDKMLI